jgi:hypothetical protein
MKMAIRRSLAAVSVCRRTAWNPGQKPAGGAERAERREGKIKQSGTLSGRFGKLLLSAHWLGSPRAALHLRVARAAHRLNTLALQAFQRHYSLRQSVFAPSRPEWRR